MTDREKILIDEVNLWLKINNDHVLAKGSLPSRRMQEALLHALEKLNALRSQQHRTSGSSPAGDFQNATRSIN